MERQHVITMALALALTGCGQANAPVAVALAPVAAPAVQAAAPVAAPVGLKVTKQHATMTIQGPVAAGTGAISMVFVFRKPGYALTATSDDVQKLTVALKTRSFLLMKTVATAEVRRDQMVAGRAAVQFTGLAAGNYTLDVAAADAAGKQLATTTVTAVVKDAETTTVDAKLQVSGS